jgi:two-component system CheB/CheR fusion protein
VAGQKDTPENGPNGQAMIFSDWSADVGVLKNILVSSGIAIIALDSKLRLQVYTPAATSLFHIKDSDIGQPMAKIRPRFNDDDLLLDAQTVIETGVSLLREIEAESGIFYNRRLLPYRGSRGEIKGTVITFADISEVKQVKLAIEEARAYSNSIIDTIRVPMVVLDPDQRILSASLPFYRSFSVNPGTTVGRKLTEIENGRLDVPGIQLFLKIIADDLDYVAAHEIEIDLPRGRQNLILTAHRVASEQVVTGRLMLVIEDVTDRKAIETDLNKAKHQAELANLGKSRFLAAASHDLRQPLQTMSLLHDMLAKRATDADSVRMISKLGDSLDVMAAILNKILDITQLEAGVVKPDISVFPIEDLLSRIRDDFTLRAEGKGLSCRVVNSRHMVRSDPTLLEQMIRNLVSNALKYTQSGKILLGCRWQGPMVRIEIWDTGVGIPAAQLRAVFEEFHQLDNPARESARGFGLGLSIVQRLGELLDHHVDVRSVPGKGSVFSITLPREAMRPHFAPPLASNASSPRRDRRDLVLIVEDDPAIREMLQMLFEFEGYSVATCVDGRQALELVSRDALRPAIVVTDFNLPNSLSGVDVARRLRELLGRSLPVIIVTGDISVSTLTDIADAHCVQLNKPVKANDLIGLVRSQIATMRQVRSPAPIAAQPIPAVPKRQSRSCVYLIDDNDELRSTMRELLEYSGHTVEAYPSSEAFLASYQPDIGVCLVVDARLPGLDGMALLQQLKTQGRGMPSIMITGFGDITMAVDAMKAGAIDFIEKPVSPKLLLAAIEHAVALSRDKNAQSDWQAAAKQRLASLTPRERQVMDLVIAGRPNKIISADLDLSQRTVEKHRAAIMHKTKSKSLSDLVRLVITAN